MKKIILILTFLLLIAGCGKKEEIIANAKMNNNSEIIKEQTVYNLTMKNVSLSYKDGISTFQVQVTNNSASDITIQRLDIIFKTENGTVITELNGSLGDEIKVSDTINLIITSDIDLSEAYSLEYRIN